MTTLLWKTNSLRKRKLRALKSDLVRCIGTISRYGINNDLNLAHVNFFSQKTKSSDTFYVQFFIRCCVRVERMFEPRKTKGESVVSRKEVVDAKPGGFQVAYLRGGS